MSNMNTGSIDLEAVLNVRRRTLASIGETILPNFRRTNTDTIYLKREDYSNSILSIDSKIIIFGDLQLLCGIFERYATDILIYEESSDIKTNTSPVTSAKNSFSGPSVENEKDDDGPPIVSMLQRSSIPDTNQLRIPSSEPANLSGPSVNPFHKKTIHAIGRAQSIANPTVNYASQNLEGKRYGCIELPKMKIIEILEALLRIGLELVDVFSDYDQNKVLHQEFIFKNRQASVKHGTTYFKTS